ncbi:Hpt domain-containing protein [Aeoliella sp.]|uniref:Hpt domain-containing protein n=1 Tax=Aeoliella sp. TaxID=2795800 RepID=UPI003CCBA45C
MLRNLTIRMKLLAIVCAVAALFASTVAVLGTMANQHLVATMKGEIERSTQVATEYIESRFRQLDAGLGSLVDTPEIRAVLTSEGIDHDTQLMSIIDLQHVLGADAIIYCDPKGKTLARTDDPFDTESIVAGIPMIDQALKGEVGKGFWNLDDTQLLSIAFPVTLDGEVEGVVMAGLNVDGDATLLRSLLLRDVVLTLDGQVISSSLGTSTEESPASDELAQLDTADIPVVAPDTIATAADVKALPRPVIGNEETIAAAVSVLPESNAGLEAIVLVPFESVFGFFNDFRHVLLAMGALTVGLSIAVTFYIGAIISGQVRSTLDVLEKVAEGDLTSRLDMDTKDEFGRIAAALNTAIHASAETMDALAIRNRDTRMLLDAVEQGFFTVDAEGVMSEERSGAVDRTFGAPKQGMTLPEFVAQFDPKVAGWIEFGLEEVFDQIMPVEVTIDQLPSRFLHGDRTFSIHYTPVYVEDQLHCLAVVVSDITAAVENEKLEAVQREMLAMVTRIADDKPGFLEFFQEADELVASLRDEPRDDTSLVKRRVHTLKGNTSIFGLERIAEICHHMEDYISENNELPPEPEWDKLFEAWQSERENVQRIIGEKTQGIELSEAEYAEILEDVVNEKPRNDLAVRLASWKLEPTARRLGRVAEQARALGTRLGKGDVRVNIRDESLRIETTCWAEFWSSFVHVVRNAIDHGLESPQDRLELGKPEMGRIEMSMSFRLKPWRQRPQRCCCCMRSVRSNHCSSTVGQSLQPHPRIHWRCSRRSTWVRFTQSSSPPATTREQHDGNPRQRGP